MTRRVSRGAAIAALVLSSMLAACGGPVDPNRPPLYDYEFDPVHDEQITTEPSRV